MSHSGATRPEPITANHGVDDFDSGEASLDAWLRRRALRNHASGASRCFVITDGNAVIGYYTLSAGSICHEAAPKAMRRNMPDPLPVLLLARLAIDQRHQNLGLGQALLRGAMLRSVSAVPSRSDRPPETNAPITKGCRVQAWPGTIQSRGIMKLRARY